MIFATHSYQYLKDELVRHTSIAAGHLESSTFPDGERYRRIHGSVVNKDVILIGGTVNDEETLELYDLACALVKYGARSLSLVIPYFGYSTMERETLPGEVLPAKTRARLFSVIPHSPWGNRVFLLDLHTPGLPHYFEQSIRHVLMSSEGLLVQSVKREASDGLVIVAPDAGRAKQVEKLAEQTGWACAFMLKTRLSGERTQVKALFGDVRGKTALLYDDMIRSGSTLLEAGKNLIEHGAKEVIAVASHGIFPGTSVEKLQDAKVLSRIHLTNSHPRAVEMATLYPGFIFAESIAPLIAKSLEQQAISAL